MKYKDIAMKTGVPKHTVDKILTRKQWVHLYENDRWKELSNDSSDTTPSV